MNEATRGEEGKTAGRSSPAERERRMAALRSAMSNEGLAALIICGRGDLRYRGRVFYATDVWQLRADTFVVIPPKGDPIFVNDTVHGITQAKLTGWATEFRTSETPGHEVGKILSDLGLARMEIGVVGLTDSISAEHLKQIEAVIPDARLRDATRLFEEIRQVKSEEELSNLRETSAIFRRVFAELDPTIRPGMTEVELIAEAHRLLRRHGARDGIYVGGRTTPFMGRLHAIGHTELRRDAPLMIWLEAAGPSGYWLEFRRCYSFGSPPDDVRRFWELQVEAVTAGIATMKPGAPAQDFATAYGRAHSPERVKGGADVDGRPLPYHLHGIGTDAIEGMWIPGKERILRENEVVCVHPSIGFYNDKDAQALASIGITDSVVITQNGGIPLTYPTMEFVVL